MERPKTHTPAPWLAEDNRELNDAIWIGGEHPEVGFVTHAEVRSGCEESDELGDLEANAKHVVRCVNAHDELVKALRRCIQAAHDAKVYLNLQGIPCPAGIALAA